MIRRSLQQPNLLFISFLPSYYISYVEVRTGFEKERIDCIKRFDIRENLVELLRERNFFGHRARPHVSASFIDGCVDQNCTLEVLSQIQRSIRTQSCQVSRFFRPFVLWENSRTVCVSSYRIRWFLVYRRKVCSSGFVSTDLYVGTGRKSWYRWNLERWEPKDGETSELL